MMQRHAAPIRHPGGERAGRGPELLRRDLIREARGQRRPGGGGHPHLLPSDPKALSGPPMNGNGGHRPAHTNLCSLSRTPSQSRETRPQNLWGRHYVVSRTHIEPPNPQPPLPPPFPPPPPRCLVFRRALPVTQTVVEDAPAARRPRAGPAAAGAGAAGAAPHPPAAAAYAAALGSGSGLL